MADTTPTPAIDTSHDVAEQPPPIATFEAMGLSDPLLRGIYANGFDRPSAIQSRAIMPIIAGGDVLAQAQSGTGKTGAFTISVLQSIDFQRRACQALILCPTRELAMQTHSVMSTIGAFMSDRGGSFCHCFVGGTRPEDDIRKLELGVQVAVGCPGRVASVIRQGYLRTSELRVVVLDEADVMLAQGFVEQVLEIFKYLPKTIQIALFSATLPEDVIKLSEKFMRKPTRILVAAEKLTLAAITQSYVAVEDDCKLLTLGDLYDSVSISQSVIFCNTRETVTRLAKELNAMHHAVSYLHADMAKGDREKIMATFKAGTTRVLITTDVLARGIDVQHVNVVINYDIPSNLENYLHRVGRSGRWGRQGIAITFVASKDIPKMREIEAHYKIQISELSEDFADHLQ